MKYLPYSFRIFLILLFTANTMVFAQGLGNVKGKISTESGKRLANVKVTARRDGKNLKSTITDSDGKFRLNGLRAGKYNLVFEKDGYSSGVLYNVLIKKKKTNNIEGKRIFLTVDEGTLVIIKGSVFNQFGRSVYGAKVRIEEVGVPRKKRRRGLTYSSISGQFTFRFPEGPRKFRITATAKKATSSQIIEVSEPAIYRLALTLTMPVKKKTNSL